MSDGVCPNRDRGPAHGTAAGPAPARRARPRAQRGTARCQSGPAAWRSWPVWWPVCLALSLSVYAASPRSASAAGPKTTPVNIDTKPAGAEVTLLEPAPERPLGTAPLAKMRLPQGPVKLRLRLAGHLDKVEVIQVGTSESSFSFELVRQIQPATLDLTADPASQGADVTVDGEAKGKLPLKVQLPPGKHQVSVRKAGFAAWERWLDLTENQTASFEIALKPSERPKGSLLVASSPPGAEVRISGQPRGKAPQTIANLSPGNYEVELTLDGHEPLRQTVAVREGQSEAVSLVLRPLASPTGELTLLCDAPQGVVYLDGEAKGPSPAKVAGLQPGEHVAECRAAGLPPAQQTVTVRAGEARAVTLTPRQAVAASRGSLSVSVNIATAKVRVGEGEWRKTPAVFDDLPPGKVLVTASADGHTTETATADVQAQRTTEVKLALQAVGKIEVRVALGKQAKVYVDGAIRGPAPVTVEAAVGPHKVRVVQEGVAQPASEEFDVAVNAGQVAVVTAQLLPPPVPRLVRRSNPTSAHVNDVGKGTVQLGVGLPVLGQLTVMAGVAPDIAAGVDIALSGMINEFVLTGAYRIAGTRAVAFGVQGGLGGGLGPSDRSSFTLHVKPIASLLLGDSASFSVYGQLRFFSDSFPDRSAKGPGTVRPSGLLVPVGMQTEFQLSPSWNVWAKFEMDFLRAGARKIYNDPLDAVNGKAAGTVGLTWLPN